MDNGDYFFKHSEELSKKYPGKYIAVVDNKLVAIDKSNVEVFQIAKQKYQKKWLAYPTFLEKMNY